MSKHFKPLTRTITACLLAVSCLLAALCLAGCSPAQAPLPTATRIIPPSATPKATQTIPPSATPTATLPPTATLAPTVPGDAPFTVYSHPELSGKIAFVGGCDFPLFYTMNADGTGLSEFADIPDVKHPTWSPDGKQIAYCESSDSAENLYVVNADGSGRRQLPANVNDTCELFWEPDGQRIRFVSLTGHGESCVYAVKADGSGAAELYNPFNIPELCDGRLFKYLTWAPDGTKFFIPTSDVPARGAVITINGSEIGKNLGGLQQHWSLDSRKLAFVLNGNVIAIANSDGSEQTLLLRLETPLPSPYYTEEIRVYDLAWSPDGKKIAIVLGCEIAVLDIESGNLSKLVEGCTVDPIYFFTSISWTR
jgi:dipeptidyl aminopeptidase/acylaminoacyl peptidase